MRTMIGFSMREYDRRRRECKRSGSSTRGVAEDLRREKEEARWGRRNGIAWTANDVVCLLAMKSDRRSWRQIAAHLHRSESSCFNKWKSLSKRADVVRVEIPQHALLDRDRRRDASDLRTLTARLAGDPPPGFSALDRMRTGL